MISFRSLLVADDDEVLARKLSGGDFPPLLPAAQWPWPTPALTGYPSLFVQ
jgi:hypothetical protein